MYKLSSQALQRRMREELMKLLTLYHDVLIDKHRHLRQSCIRACISAPRASCGLVEHLYNSPLTRVYGKVCILCIILCSFSF